MTAVWTPAYRLYVVEFTNGVIKAGITAAPGLRRTRQLECIGPIRQHHYTGFVAGRTVEGELIKRLAAIGCVLKGREWFTGIRFAVAAQLARQVAARTPA